MFKVCRVSIFIFLSSILISTVVHAYDPPLGIPDPSSRWGTIDPIDDPVPARPISWISEQPGYYYVDPDTGSDIGNTYGYPGKPRATIPDGTKVAPGAYIELTGIFPSDTGINGLKCTETQPCWLVGSETAPPNFKAKFRITNNSYLLIDNIECGNGIGDCIIISKSGHHITLRNSYIHDRIHGGGGETAIGIGAPDHGVKMHDIVTYNNKIVRVGDVTVTEDQDFHGHSVNTWGRYYSDGTELHHVWILDSYCEEASGDCIQVNGGLKPQSELALNHVYIGRNESIGNRQTNTGVKQSTDVIVSQNKCKNAFASGGNAGGCYAHQYPKDWVWFIFNEAHNAAYGFRNSSNQPPTDELGNELDPDSYERKVFVIGNLFVDIKNNPADTRYALDGDRGTGWKDGAGIAWTNSNATTMYAVDNTIYRAWTCLSGNRRMDEVHIHGNICAEIQDGEDSQLSYGQISYDGRDAATGRVNITTNYNYFIDDVENRYKDGFPDSNGTWTNLNTWKSLSPNPICTNCLEEVGPASNIFVNPTTDPNTWNFSLVDGARPVGANKKHEVYQMFKDRYGIDIYVDFNGMPRSATAPSMGAFETPGSNIVEATKPLPPEHFEVIKIIQN